MPNLTGTAPAYRPRGSQLATGERPAATGDYVPWTPGNRSPAPPRWRPQEEWKKDCGRISLPRTPKSLDYVPLRDTDGGRYAGAF